MSPIQSAVDTEGPFYLVRLTQTYVSFRKPELDSLASLCGADIAIVNYCDDSPFCVLKFTNRTADNTAKHALARSFISHSILAKSIYEFYGTAETYEALHTIIKSLSAQGWESYRSVSFKFSIDAFCGKRTTSEQREIIEGFNYLPFEGRIAMKNPEEEFVVFEEWEGLSPEEHKILNTGVSGRENKQYNSEGETREAVKGSSCNNTADVLVGRNPKRLYFGRYIGSSQRDLIVKHDLKKRPYISTTSMDAELALVTATLAKAQAGKLFLDPFTGTGGFMVAAAELGAVVLGADIDGRSFRGKGQGLEKGVGANFRKYGLEGSFGDCITADLTNSPFRLPGYANKKSVRWVDGIICDPPYGVREGLKVLGRRVQEAECGSAHGRTLHDGPYFVDGVPSHTLPGFIAPKRPYSFNRMLDDILDFAARVLVDGGRLAFWMPCANDADEEFPIPQHKGGMLELRYNCIQIFNKWSRRLLVYERIAGESIGLAAEIEQPSLVLSGHKADELNQFRRMYFRGFHGGST